MQQEKTSPVEMKGSWIRRSRGWRGVGRMSWLDRRVQTDVFEYRDRYDVAGEVEQTVISRRHRGDHQPA